MLTLDSFKAMVKSDLRLKALLESIRNGNINKLTSSEYTHTLSGILGKTFGENVLEIAPDEREKLFGELLKYCYEEVNAVCVETQVHLDREKGLNLQPLKADYPAERVTQAAHSLIDPTVIDDVIRRRARSTSENITNSFHDDFVKKNAEFRNDAGMKSYLNRQTDGSCCKWCTKIAGRYDYGKAPEDIFRRHDNCTCTVTFESGRFRQDVWSKKSWEEAPKGVKIKKPTVLSQEQGQAIQNSIMSQYMGIDNSSESGIIKENNKSKPVTEITDKAIESVPKVNISGYTDEQCAIIQNQHKELLKYSRKNNNNNEVAFVFDSSLSNRREYTGSDDIIDFGSDLSGNDLVLLHNHPRNSSYSFNDIVEFFGNDSIKTITIVKNNGKVETLTKVSTYNKLDLLKSLSRIDKDIKKKAPQKGEFRDNLYRKATSKFLNNNQLGGLIEWIK